MKTIGTFGCFFLSSFLLLFLTGAVSAEEMLGDTGQPGLAGISGSEPSVLPEADANMAAGAREAQALMDGEVIAEMSEELGDTGQPGLAGISGSQPFVLPETDASMAAGAREVQALMDGEVIAGMSEELGDSGQPGLGGDSGSKPWYTPAAEETITDSSQVTR